MIKGVIYNSPFMFSCKAFSFNDLNFFPEDVNNLTPVRGQDEKSQTPKRKFASLQRGSTELETNRTISRGCLRFSVLPS